MPTRSRWTKGSFTIGAGAGFAGDRIEPAVRMARSGEVDAIALECLAERTLVSAIRTREANPDAGYDPRLRRRFTPLLPHVGAHCRVVTNLGAANPRAAADATARLARELGRHDLRVAAVIGDDVKDRVREVQWTQTCDDGEWIGAHVYLGLDPMIEALDEGADIVITGRVADSSLVAAAPVQALGLRDAALASALTIGHLLECSGQLTGGNLTEPGIDDLAGDALAYVGYPIADIDANGTSTIRLLSGQAGRLNVVSCTLQLLYEVHDPAAYVTPDAVLDFTGIAFDPIAENHVALSGVRASARPGRLKVIGFLARRGVIADIEIAYSGTGALGRARLAADVLRARLPRELGIDDFIVDFVGVNSVLGAGALPLQCEPPELRVHISARCADSELAQAVEDEVYALTISGPAGGGSVRSERRGRIESITGFLPREQVRPHVEWARTS
jgi:acyclic terpene utilization AtuA family protein